MTFRKYILEMRRRSTPKHAFFICLYPSYPLITWRQYFLHNFQYFNKHAIIAKSRNYLWLLKNIEIYQNNSKSGKCFEKFDIFTFDLLRTMSKYFFIKCVRNQNTKEYKEKPFYSPAPNELILGCLSPYNMTKYFLINFHFILFSL